MKRWEVVFRWWLSPPALAFGGGSATPPSASSVTLPPPPPMLQQPQGAQASADAQKRAEASKGFGSTIMTSPLGDTSTPSRAAAQLLGGGASIAPPPVKKPTGTNPFGG